MSLNHEHLELLRRYMDGTATAAEMHLLETILRDDPEFRRQFLRYANVDATLGGGRLELHRDEVNSAYATTQGIPVSSKMPGSRPGWSGALKRVLHRPLGAAAALVASLILVTLLTIVTLPGNSAAATLKHALVVHRIPLDRCYRFSVNLNPDLWETDHLLANYESRLWTRGDRFWIESLSDERMVAWGREVNGNVWIALSSELGIRMDADEVGERMALHCDLRSLQIESLLQAVLADFDIRIESGSEQSELIYATLKEGHYHPNYRAALLEIDTRTGVLLRLVLDCVRHGRKVATVTFILDETSLQPDASYTLEGHLSPNAEVFDRKHRPRKRTALLADKFYTIRPPKDQ